jgi:hypothetical protein
MRRTSLLAGVRTLGARAPRDEDGRGLRARRQARRLATTLAFALSFVTALVPITLVLLLVAALAVLRRLQSSAFRSIQLGATLTQVAERGREVIDHLFRGSRGRSATGARERDSRTPSR